ncbi:unnamed protein product [Oppiella nova]|uniref:legumain n=1 Tax=Oppiella nova TaxID=334625 RepID=A0A7R9QM99_9ACAR|nr:unnamed protein product [Oppiella nova]CAG2167835.1 unnamed protein product [Oppiella nova]
MGLSVQILTLVFLSYITVNALPFGDHLVPGVDNSNKWVVLCAGSGGWENYGDQAVVYRAYHLLRSYGIPDDHIIVFHYDDIANDTENPTPGIVINEIGGPDVYKGVPKDYTGDDNNPDNFLKVIQGDLELAYQGKKVVNSGVDDHIFILFADHGASHYVQFSTGLLHADDLNNAFISMHKNNSFAKLVVYIDACESGSMFRKILPDNINVYAISSSKHNELSWYWNYSEKYKTFLSSFFANNWLVNDEQNDLDKEAIQQQYEYFKEHTLVNYTWLNTTHVLHAQQYGDLSISNLTVSQFLGHKPKGQTNTVTKSEQNNDAVNKWDVSLDLLHRRIDETEDIDEKNGYLKKLENLYKGRQYVDNHMTEYVNSIQHFIPNIATNAILHTKQELNNRHCYRLLVDTFQKNCFDITKNSYTLRKMNIFVNICEHLGHDSNGVNTAVDHLLQYCRHNIQPEFATNIV